VEASAGEIVGDRRRLEQAIGNVLRNAVHFTPSGGRVLVHAAGTSRGVEIVISDNGPGIAPAEQALVFDRFQRSGPQREGHNALGLGLPLARQFVEAHGGTLTLESEVGHGTSVTCFLPRSRS
jgi:signal transduction histidine kinase